MKISVKQCKKKCNAKKAEGSQESFNNLGPGSTNLIIYMLIFSHQFRIIYKANSSIIKSATRVSKVQNYRLINDNFNF